VLVAVVAAEVEALSGTIEGACGASMITVRVEVEVGLRGDDALIAFS
jgi:hypothetical protein